MYIFQGAPKCFFEGSGGKNNTNTLRHTENKKIATQNVPNLSFKMVIHFEDTDDW